MALGLTQPLTEMSTGIFPGGKGGQCVGLNLLKPSGPVKACNEIDLPYYIYIFVFYT
jgi:hypothetical protein